MNVKEWMSASELKLNPDKTKFIVFGSKRQREKLKAHFPSTILCSPLCLLSRSRIWVCGSILIFPCGNMFNNVCKSCFVQLRDFRHVRWFLTYDASVLVANALVSS